MALFYAPLPVPDLMLHFCNAFPLRTARCWDFFFTDNNLKIPWQVSAWSIALSGKKKKEKKNLP